MEIGKVTTILGKIQQLLKIKAYKLTKIKIINSRNNRNKIILNIINADKIIFSIKSILSRILDKIIKINKIYNIIPMI